MRKQTKRSLGHPQDISNGQSQAVAERPIHTAPLSDCDDLQTRIAKRAYELHAQRGYRQGYALEDWVEAEREIVGQECSA